MVLTPAEAAAVVGGLPDCYAPTTASCDAVTKFCTETECNVEEIDTGFGKISIYRCPGNAEEQKQTQGSYNTVFQSSGGTKDNKKDEAKINCLKVFQCKSAGGTGGPNSGGTGCEKKMSGKWYCTDGVTGPAIRFEKEKTPQVPDGKDCE